MSRYRLFHSLLFTNIFISLSFPGIGQSDGYLISGLIQNYEGQIAYLDLVYGDSEFPVDSTSVSEGKFVFSGTPGLRTGAYHIVLPPNSGFYVLMDENVQQLNLEGDIKDIEGTINFQGSGENTLYYSYVRFLSEKQTLLDTLMSGYEAQTNEADKLALLSRIQQLKAEVKSYQLQLVTNAPASLTAAIVRCELSYLHGTAEDVQTPKNIYAKEHYFDNIHLDDERLIYAPGNVLVKKVDYYLDSVIAQNADSVIAGVDLILRECEPAPASYKFFLGYLFNRYRVSKIIGVDAVYVHIAEDYVATGKAPWLNASEKAMLLAVAASIAPTLIGKKAPDFQVQTEDGKNITLYEIQSPYIILIFWAPRCSHCQRSLPLLADFYEKFKSKGVEVFTVCTKINEQEKACWEYLDKNLMHDWINGSDQMGGKSGVNDLYHVRRTPAMFVLDKDKTILTKGLEVEQLEDFLHGLMQ